MMRSIEFECVFNYFDEDGDGIFSALELRQRLGSRGGELLMNEAEIAVESLDSDGDGLLGLEDLVGLMEAAVDDEEERLKELREAFGMYDADGCGFISPNDLKVMLRKLGESKSSDECKVMIHHFDLNGNGVLSFEEFRVMIMQ